ncbi:MAG TPA: LTA synthase family protein [Chitinophagaceae bacterium]|nr:LTA synthase family protein [Chitinophagaceae bacterium]
MLFVFFRVLFFAWNHAMFPGDWTNYSDAVLKGLAFDVWTALIYMIPYSLCVLGVLMSGTLNRSKRLLLNSVYSLILLGIVCVSMADIFYFAFSLRRINKDAISLLHDSTKGIWAFAAAHPIALVIFLGSLIGIYLSVVLTSRMTDAQVDIQRTQKPVSGLSLFLATLIILTVVNAKFLSPMSASLWVNPGQTALYTNSTQSFLYSFRSSWNYVKKVHYFTPQECDSIMPVFYQTKQSPSGKNVMLFILESFSYAYLNPLNAKKPYTPFFDSLIQHSTFFTRAYANNVTSANGLGSILSGLPSLIDQPFFSSAYADHPIAALGIGLQGQGYETHFSMGANDDHFGFKKGVKLLGISNYHNGEHFNPSLHDGTWGIYDGPFLQTYRHWVGDFKQPFFSTLFTITSHYPFKVPAEWKGKFPLPNGTPNEEAVAYVDRAFRDFFDSIQHEPWFQHTIFIFTGDHVSKENTHETFNPHSYYHIPIFIFDPQQPGGKKWNDVVQHTDLPATIADITGLQAPVLCFGHSMYDTLAQRFTVNRYNENLIQWIDNDYLLQYDLQGQKFVKAFRILPDDGIQPIEDGPLKQSLFQERLSKLQAYMQQYYNRLEENRLTPLR